MDITKVTWSRLWSSMMLAVSVILSGALVATLFFRSEPVEMPKAIKAFCWFLLVVIVYAVYVSVKLLLFPKVLFQIEKEGVRTFYDRSRRDYSSPEGFLVVWPDVHEISLVKFHRYENTVTWAIALKLRDGSKIPVERVSFLVEAPGVVYLDALTGSVRKEKLLRLIVESHARFFGREVF